MSARDRLTVLASRQGGLIAVSQVRGLAIDRTTISRLVSAGCLSAEAGTYRVLSIPHSAETPLWRAVLVSGGVLSHFTAARLLGAELVCEVVHVTAGPNVRCPAALHEVVMHRSRRVPPHHTRRNAAGLPHTIPPRTFVDLAAPGLRVSDASLMGVLDTWVSQKQIDLAWLGWFLEKESMQLAGRPRAMVLWRSITGQRIESHAERKLARLLRASGVDPFVTQYGVDLDGKHVARLDFAWPRQRVALELDGYRYHSSPRVFAADRVRGNAIELAGWLLLRTTPTEVSEQPQRLIYTVTMALGLRGRERATGDTVPAPAGTAGLDAASFSAAAPGASSTTTGRSAQD
jgi:very-short-patch-repair endonuclease